MKNFFLWAVAISALCSSCETADEQLVENNNSLRTKTTVQSRTVSDFIVYTNVVNSFIYNYNETHDTNLIRYQNHVNNIVPSGSGTEVIDFTQLNTLENANNSIIEQFNYTTETKTAINAILNNTFTTDILATITNTQEYDLVNTLYAIQQEGDGDYGDKEWKQRRTIAFAYGAQYNLTKAILYAGAVDLKKYIL